MNQYDEKHRSPTRNTPQPRTFGGTNAKEFPILRRQAMPDGNIQRAIGPCSTMILIGILANVKEGAVTTLKEQQRDAIVTLSIDMAERLHSQLLAKGYARGLDI